MSVTSDQLIERTDQTSTGLPSGYIVDGNGKASEDQNTSRLNMNFIEEFIKHCSINSTRNLHVRTFVVL